jgi:GTP-binding protein
MTSSPNEIVEAEFFARALKSEEMPPPVGIEIAFLGRSNVGKSSLLNRLTGRKALARTSSTPGCTRGITMFQARTRNDLQVFLVDLPGYGYASRSRSERESWASLIENYLLERPTLKAAAVLFDARRGLETEERDLLKLLGEPAPGGRAVPYVLVATKADKLPRPQRVAALRAHRVGSQIPVAFSVEIPETTAQVWNALLTLVSN